MTKTPFTLADIQDPSGQRLLYLLRRMNEQIEQAESRLSALSSTPKPTDSQSIDHLASLISSDLGARGRHPLNVTALPGLLAEPQTPSIIQFASDPTTTAKYAASLYEVGTIGTYSGGFYYVKSGNPHSWGTLTLSAPTNMMTTDTDQTMVSTVNKTWQGQQIFASTSSGAVLVKPGSAPSANTKLFDLQSSGGSSLASIDAEGDLIVNNLTANDCTVNDLTAQDVVVTTLAVGPGNALTFVALYAVSLTPSAVSANTTSEQTFSGFTAANTGMVVMGWNKPTHQAGLGIVGARVSGSAQIALTFANVTGASITPTAAETYSFVIASV